MMVTLGFCTVTCHTNLSLYHLLVLRKYYVCYRVEFTTTPVVVNPEEFFWLSHLSVTCFWVSLNAQRAWDASLPRLKKNKESLYAFSDHMAIKIKIMVIIYVFPLCRYSLLAISVILIIGVLLLYMHSF